jgi:5-deoxy-glucuronate isomerase
MNLLVKCPGQAPGVYTVARRGLELKYLSFTIVRLGAGFPVHEFDTGEEEVAIHSYDGAVDVTVRCAAGEWREKLAARTSLAEPGPMIYAPAGSSVTLSAEQGAHLVVAGALGHRDADPQSAPAEAKQVGKDNWLRTVYTHLGETVPARHLICGETVNQPGGWSSCPPHKHDTFHAPSEVPMEEVYYFQADPPQGFGFMRVYTRDIDPAPFDVSYAVENGDTVMIPRGYHPVAACPGYTLTYSWFLAGEGRVYGAWSDDPRHSWIKK